MSQPSASLTAIHLERLRRFFDAIPAKLPGSSLHYRDLLAHDYNLLIPEHASVLEIGCGSGELLARLRTRQVTGIDLSPVQIERAQARVPHGRFLVAAGETFEPTETYDYIIISDTLNLAADVQGLLTKLHQAARPDTRVLINFHSNLWRPFFTLAAWLGLRSAAPDNNWLSSADLRNLLALTDWETIRQQNRVLCPVYLFGLDRLINRWIAPWLPVFGLVIFVTARPRRLTAPRALKVSVVVPARNEAGNIEGAVLRTPMMGAGTELIFVEGHSKDNTWAEIQRVAAAYPDRGIKILQQTGKGKGNAVREGFAQATGDILMILDADLTMPPEELPKYYEVLASGRAEFANGCRLVYPMESEAMQFLNLCANKTFGILFTWLLGQPLKDTLCGTKVLSREHYERIVANRAYFGDFDPFGDFDLLFGAGKLNLKIADIPIRYRDRTYGQTNIQRWKHGWLLLRMVLFAARKLKFV
jgi:SAM-dependent methyltransferase